jgi:hypothetical protein
MNNRDDANLEKISYEKNEPNKPLVKNKSENGIITQPKLGSHCYIGPHIQLEKKSITYHLLRLILCCGGCCRSKMNTKKEK